MWYNYFSISGSQTYKVEVKTMTKHPTNKYDYSDPEVLKRLLGRHYMSDEKRKELEEKTASGELVVISNDDPYAPYYPPVSLEKSQADLRKLVETMRKEG